MRWEGLKIILRSNCFHFEDSSSIIHFKYYANLSKIINFYPPKIMKKPMIF